MSQFTVLNYGEPSLKDPVAVVGFPSVGLVGSIVSSYLARALDLPVTAAVCSPDLPPYALVQEGRCYPPIRIYAGPLPKKRHKTAKKKDGESGEEKTQEAKKTAPRGKKRDVVVVTSEIAPKPEQTEYIAASLFEALDSLGVKETVCLDGMPRITAEQKGLMGLGSSDAARKRVEDLGLTLMKDGIVRGISGVMLYMGEHDGRDVECILCPANPQLPDPRAAADLLPPLETIIPGLNIDPTPLTNEANEIDSRMKAQMQQQTVNHNIYG
jgi:uncharacterized protein